MAGELFAALARISFPALTGLSPFTFDVGLLPALPFRGLAAKFLLTLLSLLAAKLLVVGLLTLLAFTQIVLELPIALAGCLLLALIGLLAPHPLLHDLLLTLAFTHLRLVTQILLPRLLPKLSFALLRLLRVLPLALLHLLAPHVRLASLPCFACAPLTPIDATALQLRPGVSVPARTGARHRRKTNAHRQSEADRCKLSVSPHDIRHLLEAPDGLSVALRQIHIRYLNGA